jgi:4-hydroxy-3-polyprenylbenzoate decarboxylase
MTKSWVVAISGASGAIYGVRLIEYLLSQGYALHLIITDAGWRVLGDELDWQTANRKQELDKRFGSFGCEYTYYPIRDIGANTASGSFRTMGMVVVPCSMGTLSGIAHGSSDNLLERTADVMLKEGRKLILVPRETPLHEIHLRNMLILARMGARILPAMPGFYHKPASMDEIVDFLVGKILDSMDIDHELYRRWGSTNEPRSAADSHREN